MSARYNTGNPIESTDVRDMSDNVKNLDLFSNSSDMAFDDRFGVERKTIHGMNSEFNYQILNMGFTHTGTFSSGATLTNPRQTLLWDIADGGDGHEYGWSGSFLPSGKIVPPGSTPLTTGGIAVGAWMSRLDPEMRIQVRESLRRSYAEAGYTLVAGSFEVGGTLVNANDVLLQESAGKAFTGPAGIVAAGTNPASGGFIDRSNDLLITYKTVSDMLKWAPQLPIGARVAWCGYFVEGDCGGGRGVIKSGPHTEDGGSIFSLGATKYIEAFLPATVLSIKFGVKFDNDRASAALNTTRLQAWVDYIGTSHREGMLGFGVAWHNGITITKNTKIKGVKSLGPNFGPLPSHVGSTLRNASLNNHCVVVDATGNPPNVGLNCVFEDFTVYGNRQLAGAVGGHNIVLRADTTGEVTFIEGCQFNRIQSLYAKGMGLAIEGTVFANDFSYCSFTYNGTHGVSRGAPGGSPITNNFHGCKFFENLQWGVYSNGITMSLSTCNIAQNHAGGFLGESGYVELINCDFEANDNVAIETSNSSGSGILVVGGKIHKTPGTKPGTVGIRAAAGSSGGMVQGMFFANYTEVGDKIFESTGGSLSEFSYRLQNVTTGQLTPTDMEAIERIPNLDKTYRGTLEFPGSGIGIRVATLTVPTPFKVGFNVAGTVQRLFEVNPAPGGIYVEPSTKTLGSVKVYINVTYDVGTVYVDWIATGR